MSVTYYLNRVWYYNDREKSEIDGVGWRGRVYYRVIALCETRLSFELADRIHDENGNPLPMTPRGHSSISGAVDTELQIIPTERENITTLMCTKSRRTRNIVRRGWRRDFFYDEDSLLITPLNQESAEKQSLIEKLSILRDGLNLSNYALADKIGVNESTLRRWLSGMHYPSEIQIPKILSALKELEGAPLNTPLSTPSDAPLSTPQTAEITAHKAETDSSLIYTQEKKESNKEIKSNNVKSVKRKAKKTTTSRPKIDLNNPCLSCPAYKEKGDRFVDGEGDCSNGIMFIAQCPGEVEMTSELRITLICPASLR